MERRGDAFEKRSNQSRKIIDTIRPAAPTFTDHTVFVPDDAWSVELSAKLLDNRCRRVFDHGEASLFIMNNPASYDNPDDRRIHWAAALKGSAICTPMVYTHGHQVPWMRYKCALAANHIVWASPAFQHAHPRLWYVILSSINATASNNWQLVDLHGYLSAKLKYPRGNKVIGMCATEEYDATVRNLFTAEMLFSTKFIRDIDPLASRFA